MADRSLAELVRQGMQRRGLGQAGVAAQAGVSQSLVSNLISGTLRRYSAGVLWRISQALELDPAEVLAAAAQDEPVDESQAVVEAELSLLLAALPHERVEVKRQVLLHLRRMGVRPAVDGSEATGETP